MPILSESVIEDAALDWFRTLGYNVVGGPEMALGCHSLRASHADVLLRGSLRDALARLNPDLPVKTLADALRKLTQPEGATVAARNRVVHRLLVDGVTVEYRAAAGAICGGQVRVIDFDQPEANTWSVVNQFTVTENGRTRRPDVVVFVNGIPLAVIELKNPADENATVWSAFHRLQTYQAELPSLFVYNAVLAVSDGLRARLGTLSAGREWFRPWRTIDGQELAPVFYTELQVAIEGLFEKRRFLALLRDFIVFEADGGALVKKVAGYHQFHAVEAAVKETLRAAALQEQADRVAEQPGRYETRGDAGGEPGDRRIGVVWHTPGSGRSLTMAFYAGRIIREPVLANPTVVVLTAHNDVDDQLLGTFAGCQDLLRQTPVQADSRDDLRDKLAVGAGGVVFTTIQNFLPEEKGSRQPMLSARRNIVVIAAEAHRSQYDSLDGSARHLRDSLPNASFLGFTGTPIELHDADTRAMFGNYISIYDIQRALEDRATVPIYYESRIAKLALDERERPNIDVGFDDTTELKTRWAQLEAMVGAERRLRLIARDVVNHFEDRLEAMDGKAMVVCMSRRICIDLYRELVRLRPDWHHPDDAAGALKVVMTGTADDPADWQPHIRSKRRREALAGRFRDAGDPLHIVLVRDMWLTGFDAPSLHTMYVDKPMRGHGLMQAIARVNRAFKDKPGGLVVDYLGLAHEIKHALATYTASGGTGRTALDQNEAVAVMLEQYKICCGLFHGFDRSRWIGDTPSERLRLLPAAQEHVLAQENGKERFRQAVRALSQAFAIAVPHEQALRIRHDLELFQSVQSALAKSAMSTAGANEELDHAVGQIISRVVASEGMIDIFTAAGLEKPDISILSDEFLAEVQGLPYRNLAVELLQRLLQGELAARRRRNLVRARSFAETLERTLRHHQDRSVEAVHVIEELIRLARQLREESARGADLGLADDELAFYDALEINDSAVWVLGDDTLRKIARELAVTVRRNVAIDWTLRETVRANLRRLVRRVLRKHGYPPDKQERATRTVLEQAEVLSAGWAIPAQ